MRIGLVDVDNYEKLDNCFPNLSLMKISAWHKSKGDDVEWHNPMFGGHYDIVYMSKVFSFTNDYEFYVDADEIIRGGQGIAFHLLMGKKYSTKKNIKTFPMK